MKSVRLKSKTDGYKKDLNDIRKGDKQKVSSMEKDAEKQMKKSATNVAEVKEGRDGRTGPEECLETIPGYGQEPERGDLKNVGEISTKEVKNPFIGKEVRLQAGVLQLDKLKKKYHTIPDSRYRW